MFNSPPTQNQSTDPSATSLGCQVSGNGPDSPEIEKTVRVKKFNGHVIVSGNFMRSQSQ